MVSLRESFSQPSPQEYLLCGDASGKHAWNVAQSISGTLLGIYPQISVLNLVDSSPVLPSESLTKPRGRYHSVISVSSSPGNVIQTVRDWFSLCLTLVPGGYGICRGISLSVFRLPSLSVSRSQIGFHGGWHSFPLLIHFNDRILSHFKRYLISIFFILGILFIFMLCVWMFACVYVCVSHVCLVPIQASRRYQIPWNWSCRWSWAAMRNLT